MDYVESRKRKANDKLAGEGGQVTTKKFNINSNNSNSKKWQIPKQVRVVGGGGESDNAHSRDTHPAIEPGDEGIWATCDRGREGKCVGELRDLLEQYASKLYPQLSKNSMSNDSDVELDVESAIQAELVEMRSSKQTSIFQNIKLDVQCVLFFKTIAPVDPVQLVHKVCFDALSSPLSTPKGRWIKRLTPTTLVGRASEAGLEDVARKVLAPHFHVEDDSTQSIVKKKFAIRPTIRNHSILTRDSIIRKLASIVGPNHSVDLKEYDVLILVDVYKNICGMSVVGPDYDRLKRYNLAEIYHPLATSNTSTAQE